MEIFDNVKYILFELCGIENIYLEQELQGDLALNSLQMITLIIMLEEKFQITLDESDMNPFDLISVLHIVKLIEKYVGGNDSENDQKN